MHSYDLLTFWWKKYTMLCASLYLWGFCIGFTIKFWLSCEKSQSFKLFSIFNGLWIFSVFVIILNIIILPSSSYNLWNLTHIILILIIDRLYLFGHHSFLIKFFSDRLFFLVRNLTSTKRVSCSNRWMTKLLMVIIVL